MRKKFVLAAVSLLLTLAMAVNLSGCISQIQKPDPTGGPVKPQEEDLLTEPEAAAVTGKAADDTFITAQMELAVKLFRSSAAESAEENVLISPLSIQLALAMTANGAKGETREEMEALLGSGISLEDLNEYLYSYANSLPSTEDSKLHIANSIWFRDDEGRLTVEQDFLQTNANYYRAQVCKAPFDDRTLEDINIWVKENTEGMIDSIIDEISDDVIMYLINALAFDARWAAVYNKYDVSDGAFVTVTGQERNVEMLHSIEGKYLSCTDAIGFIKDYQGGHYSFAALLPNEDIAIGDYIESLTAEDLLESLRGVRSGLVSVAMPKFSYEYELGMNEVLSQLGMPTAFLGSAADFSAMAHSSRGNIFIGDVRHKTYISVDELGTKAGAVTKVEMTAESAPMIQWSVTLDRPFLYMIVDNTTNLPVFIGAVMDI